MITLDEVIRAIEECRDSYVAGKIIKSDALHYLKEYRKDKQIYSYDIARRHFELAERNDPLTWDELKQMIDSIVWLEWSSDGKWVEIIRGFDDRIEYYRFGTDEFFYITKEEYVPDKWQAYRKERDL